MAGLLAKVRYPVVRGMVSYALIWPTCSVVQEYIEHGTTLENANWVRAARFGIFGTFFMAPVFYGWMKYTSRFFKKKTLATAITRAAIEQVSYSPLAMAYFFFGMTALEFKPLQTCIDEVKLKFWPTYKYGVIFWPLAQTLNFYFVSEKNRIIFVSCASFVWTVYLAHMKAQEHGLKGDDKEILKGEMLNGVNSSSMEGLKTAAALEGVKTVSSKEGDKSAAEGLKTVASEGIKKIALEVTESDILAEREDKLPVTVEGVKMLTSEGEEAAVIERIQEVEGTKWEGAEDIMATEGLSTVAKEGVKMIAMEEEEVSAIEEIQKVKATKDEVAEDVVVAEGVKTVVSEGVKMISTEGKQAVIEKIKEVEAPKGEGVENIITAEGIKSAATEGVTMVAAEIVERAEIEGVEAAAGEGGKTVTTEMVKTVSREGFKIIVGKEVEPSSIEGVLMEETQVYED